MRLLGGIFSVVIKTTNQLLDVSDIDGARQIFACQTNRDERWWS